jgi:NADH dehydrogenase (ubiquinone) 1 alpha subcomplex subunit 6
MTTIPSRLAQLSKQSGGLSDARKRAVQLYRDWYRSVRTSSCPLWKLRALIQYIQAPEIVSLYGLNCSAADIRHAIRQKFEEHRYVNDPSVIDILLHKGRQEYQETMNCWSQEPHILGILLAPRGRPQRSFLEKFYEGAYGTH